MITSLKIKLIAAIIIVFILPATIIWVMTGQPDSENEGNMITQYESFDIALNYLQTNHSDEYLLHNAYNSSDMVLENIEGKSQYVSDFQLVKNQIFFERIISVDAFNGTVIEDEKVQWSDHSQVNNFTFSNYNGYGGRNITAFEGLIISNDLMESKYDEYNISTIDSPVIESTGYSGFWTIKYVINYPEQVIHESVNIYANESMTSSIRVYNEEDIFWGRYVYEVDVNGFDVAVLANDTDVLLNDVNQQAQTESWWTNSKRLWIKFEGSLYNPPTPTWVITYSVFHEDGSILGIYNYPIAAS